MAAKGVSLRFQDANWIAPVSLGCLTKMFLAPTSGNNDKPPCATDSAFGNFSSPC